MGLGERVRRLAYKVASPVVIAASLYGSVASEQAPLVQPVYAGKPDEFSEQIASTLEVMLDYQPLHPKDGGGKSRAINTIRKSLDTNRSKKKFRARQWFEAIDSHVQNVYSKFDAFVDESVKNLKENGQIDAAKALRQQWTPSHELSQNYRILITKQRDGDQAAIFLFNYLCEIFQRDELVKIRKMREEFRLEPGVRLVAGGDIIFGSTKDQVKEAQNLLRRKKYLESAYGVPSVRQLEGAKKKRFENQLHWITVEHNVVRGLYVPSFFARAYVTNAEAQRVLQFDETLSSLNAGPRYSEMGGGFLGDVTRDELPKAGPDYPALGFQDPRAFVRAMSRMTGKRVDLLDEHQLALLLRTYDGRLGANTRDITPLPKDLGTAGINPRVPTIDVEGRIGKERINREVPLYDSPFGFRLLQVGHIPVYGVKRWDRPVTGKDSNPLTGYIHGMLGGFGKDEHIRDRWEVYARFNMFPGFNGQGHYHGLPVLVVNYPWIKEFRDNHKKAE